MKSGNVRVFLVFYPIEWQPRNIMSSFSGYVPSKRTSISLLFSIPGLSGSVVESYITCHSKTAEHLCAGEKQSKQ